MRGPRPTRVCVRQVFFPGNFTMFTPRTSWDTTPSRLAKALDARRRQGLPVLDLTESNPTCCGFRFEADAIAEAVSAGARHAYEPDPKGFRAAREAVCSYYSQQHVPVDPEHIVLTTGTSEGYSFAFRLLAGPGDEILSPRPSYPLFDFLADINDVRLVPYPLQYEHGWSLDVEHFAEMVTEKTRAIIVVSPNNPTGSFLAAKELEALVELARRHNLALIADEVFRDYAWGPASARARSLITVDGCLTLTLNGLSKISALPQMKLGWIAVNGPPALARQALDKLEIIADTYLSLSAPIQHATPVLLDQRAKLQPQILERIAVNLGLLEESLGPGSATTRLLAEGGWYAVLRVPGNRSDERWALELLEAEGIHVHPGSLFSFTRGSYLVLSLITPVERMAVCAERLARVVG